MMQTHKNQRIGKKPPEAKVTDYWLNAGFIILPCRNHFQNIRADKCHKHACRSMNASGSAEHVNEKSKKKCRNKQKPFRCFKRKHKDK